MRKPIHTLGDILDPSSGVTEYVKSQGTYNLTLTQNDMDQLNKLYDQVEPILRALRYSEMVRKTKENDKCE